MSYAVSVLRSRWLWGAILLVGWAAAVILVRGANETVVDCGLGESSSLNAKQTLLGWALAIQGAVFVASIAGAVHAVVSRRGLWMLAFTAFFLSALAAALACFGILYGAFAAALGCGLY
jgi:hypothetical protein